MALNNSFHNCEANAGSLEVLLRMQSLKRLEQLVNIGHVEPSTVVAHIKNRFVVVGGLSELDARLLMIAGEFPRIAE